MKGVSIKARCYYKGVFIRRFLLYGLSIKGGSITGVAIKEVIFFRGCLLYKGSIKMDVYYRGGLFRCRLLRGSFIIGFLLLEMCLI